MKSLLWRAIFTRSSTSASAGLSDGRQGPDISPQAVFLAAFYGFVFRLPSFQQLEADLAQPSLQQWIDSPRTFRDDVTALHSLRFRCAGLEQICWCRAIVL